MVAATSQHCGTDSGIGRNLGFGDGCAGHRQFAPTAAGKVGHGRQRFDSSSIPVQQQRICHRPDIAGSQQTDPRDDFGVTHQSK